MDAHQLATNGDPNPPQETSLSDEDRFSRLTTMVLDLDKQVRILRSRHDELWEDHASLRVEVESICKSLSCPATPIKEEKPLSRASRSHDVNEGSFRSGEATETLAEGSITDSPKNGSFSPQNRSGHLDSSQDLQSPEDLDDFHSPVEPEVDRALHDRNAKETLSGIDVNPDAQDVSSDAVNPGSQDSPRQGSSCRRLLRSPRIVKQPRCSLWQGAMQAVTAHLRKDHAESSEILQQEGLSPQSPKATTSAESSSSERPAYRSGHKRDVSSASGSDLYELAKPLFADGPCLNKSHILQNIQQLLSSSREPPNTWSGPGTPLSMAVSFGQTDLVRLLLRSRANPHEKCDKGVTPLHSAVFEGNLELCRLLLVARADVNMCDQHEQSPLFFSPTVEVAKLLIGRAADVRRTNLKGQSALHLAGRAGFREVLKWLTANVDATLVELCDSHGMTALQYLNLERKKINPVVSAVSLQLEQKRAEEVAAARRSPLKTSAREDGRDALTALNQLGKHPQRESDASSSEKGRKAARQLQSQRENEKLLALYRKAAKNVEATLEEEDKMRRSVGARPDNLDTTLSPRLKSSLSDARLLVEEEELRVEEDTESRSTERFDLETSAESSTKHT